MFLLALAACNNFALPEWSGGGTHYASGIAGSTDTATTGDDTGNTTVTGEGSPVLLTMSAIYQEPNEADETYIAVGVAYEDDPDNVSGGNVYYDLYANDEVQEADGSRQIVDSDGDPNTEAELSNENINFSVGPVDTSMTHALILYVVDATQSRSNEIEGDVTGE